MNHKTLNLNGGYWWLLATFQPKPSTTIINHSSIIIWTIVNRHSDLCATIESWPVKNWLNQIHAKKRFCSKCLVHLWACQWIIGMMRVELSEMSGSAYRVQEPPCEFTWPDYGLRIDGSHGGLWYPMFDPHLCGRSPPGAMPRSKIRLWKTMKESPAVDQRRLMILALSGSRVKSYQLVKVIWPCQLVKIQLCIF